MQDQTRDAAASPASDPEPSSGADARPQAGSSPSTRSAFAPPVPLSSGGSTPPAPAPSVVVRAPSGPEHGGTAGPSPVAAGASAPWSPPSSAPGSPAFGPPHDAPATGTPLTAPVPATTSGPGTSQPWWGAAASGMPITPPQYDPGQFGGSFGAAGGAPPGLVIPGSVPPLPGGSNGNGRGAAGPTSASPAAPGGSSTRTALLVGLLSAIVASLITGGLFVAFDRSSGSASTASDPRSSTASSSGSPGTLVTPLDIYRLLDRTQPSVVSIRARVSSSGAEAGSGVLISADGMVLTNAHVVAGATAIRVTLFDGTTKTANLIGSFPDDDVALIQIKDASGLTPAELGSSNDIRVGDPVVAIGNALNLGGQPSVTEGIVSAKNREIQAAEGTYKNLIQTDAAINPGNSGGPLINASGQVVGINTAIIKDAQNIGFAISIDAIKPLIEDLKQGKGAVTPDTAFLGVSTQSIIDVNAATIEKYKVTTEDGAFVSEVTPGSGAEVGGLQPGDVITKIDDQSVTTAADVGTAIRKKMPGDSVTIEYEREGAKQTATVTLTSRADGGG